MADCQAHISKCYSLGVMTSPAYPTQTLYLQWVRASFAGWLLGIPLIIVFALLGEAIGIGGVQVLVGLAMGAGIGFMQGRVLQPLLHNKRAWMLSWLIGLSLPFLLADLSLRFRWGLPYSPYIAISIGGLLVGIYQLFLLRAHFRNAGWWILGSLLGCAAASIGPGISDFTFQHRLIPGLWGALSYLGFASVGGLLLGAVSGLFLVRLRKV